MKLQKSLKVFVFSETVYFKNTGTEYSSIFRMFSPFPARAVC